MDGAARWRGQQDSGPGGAGRWGAWPVGEPGRWGAWPGGEPGRWGPGTAYRATKLRLVMPGGDGPPRLGTTQGSGHVAASAAFFGPRSRGYPAAVPGRLSLAPFYGGCGGRGSPGH